MIITETELTLSRTESELVAARLQGERAEAEVIELRLSHQHGTRVLAALKGQLYEAQHRVTGSPRRAKLVIE